MTARRRSLPPAAQVVAGAVAALLVAALALVGTAHASRITIAAGGLSAIDVGHPCAGSATATAATRGTTSYSGVSVEVPTGCSGRWLEVRLLSGTTVLGSGTAQVVASGATVVPVGSYTATGTLTVQAVVDGWALPVTWSFTPPVAAACRLTADVVGYGHDAQGRWMPILGPPTSPTSCAVTGVSPGNSWTSGGLTYSQFTVTVRNTSSVEAVWRATLNVAQSPFPTWTPRGINGLGDGQGSTGWNARAAEGCGRLPLLDVVGNEGSTQVMAPGQSRSFSFQLVSGPAGDLVCP